MKVLIGYDHSQCSEDAITGLRNAGLPAGTEALVLAAVDMWPLTPLLEEEKLTAVAGQPAAGGETAGRRGFYLPVSAADTQMARETVLQHVEQLRTEAAPAVERLQRQFPDWKVSLEVVTDSPYWALIDRAKQWEADLIVVGSHGRGIIGQTILGSVSLNVVMFARCSVRISRTGLSQQVEPLRIVLGFDASPDAELALDAVAARNWPNGTVVRLVSVVEPNTAALLPVYVTGMEPFGFHTSYPEEPPNYYSWMKAACSAAAERLRRNGLQVDVSTPEGKPKQTLLEEAQQWGADCIFVGAKGQRGGMPHSLGAVATAIATRAHCSVEVIRSWPGRS